MSSGVRFGTLLLVAVLVAGCSGAGTDAGAASAVDVAVQEELEVNGLKLRIDRVVVESDRVRVDATLHNPGPHPYSLLLGGCGPSQGRVATADGWREVYYQAEAGGDLSGMVDPGASRGVTITLKPAQALDPESVTRLQLHPGYVLNAATGELELLQVMLSLKEGGEP